MSYGVAGGGLSPLLVVCRTRTIELSMQGNRSTWVEEVSVSGRVPETRDLLKKPIMIGFGEIS